MYKLRYCIGLFIVFITCGSAQAVREIETEAGKLFITTTNEYPIFGTYHFKEAEPIVELQRGGTGQYQLHDSPKRPIEWGLECSETGTLKSVKGFDNLKYYLYYRFTDTEADGSSPVWTRVEMTVHLNAGKIFINGERMKLFTAKEEKKK